MNTFRGMRFCSDCENMLYPKEQVVEESIGRLVYDCRICSNFEKTRAGDEQDNCVYKSDHNKLQEHVHVDPECVKDPTLSRRKNIACPRCRHTEAVTFTQPTKDRMNLIFVCIKCQHDWRKDQFDDEQIQLSDDSDDNENG